MSFTLPPGAMGKGPGLPGAAWVPTDATATLEVWLKADAGVSTDVDGVNSWADQTINGKDYDQATGAKKPTLTSSFQNGLPGIQFDGVDDALARTTVILSAGFSLFIVGGTAASGYILGGGTSFDLVQRNANKLRIKTVNHTSLFANALWDDANIHLVEFHSDGVTNITAFYDTATAGAGIGNGADATDISHLGTYSGGAGFSATDLCEILLYSDEVTGADRTSAQDYLMTKWGL